jgi:diguanylate cyclase (GGDEF)-like protein
VTSEDTARLVGLERENEALRRAISMLHQIANLARRSLELEATCYAVLTGVTAGVGLGLNRAMLFLVDERDRGALHGVASVGPSDEAEADRVWKAIESDAPDLETLYEAGLRQRAHPGPLDRRVRGTLVSADGRSPVALALRGAATVREGTDDLDGLLHLPTAVAAPLRDRSGVQGVLYADNRFTGRVLDPVTELVFSMVGDHAGRAIASARHYERVARQARTDSLTGLGHHGSMMEALAAAVVAAGADARSLGLAMMDLDDFKKVNDTLGHRAGDALLVGVAERLRAMSRAGDRPFRYGGEEFAVLLPDLEEKGLLAAGERLCRAISSEPFLVDEARAERVTCSVGVACLGPAVLDAKALIEAADRALLRAKAKGKNRVELAP